LGQHKRRAVQVRGAQVGLAEVSLLQDGRWHFGISEIRLAENSG
jgi:hypothetical protein